MKKKLFLRNYIVYVLYTIIFMPLAVTHAKKYDNHLTAVITSPIAEMNNSFPAPTDTAAAVDKQNCKRAHQGLYNELVICLKEYKDQVYIACPGIMYGFHEKTKTPANTFWIHKKDLRLVNDLHKEIQSSIPDPRYAHDDVCVLIYPWNHFSVGTRFKHNPDLDTATHFAIYRANYTNHRLVNEFIPKSHALIENKQSPSSHRKLFVDIINSLIDRVDQSKEHYVIPYVWGGSSFIKPHTDNTFYKKNNAWYRTNHTDIYSGYDCSEFIMRMANIAGIYFPYKTSSLIGRKKQSLQNNDTLQEGDIIWMEGHVMIISDIPHNDIIEARGYTNGYGRVHRISLEDCFVEVKTYPELLKRYYNKQTITLKDKLGQPTGNPRPFKILKLMSHS